MALRYKCYKCLTLWSAADVGGVADGSLCHRTAAALYPQSCRGYENTAGLRFVRAGSLLRLRYGGLIVKSGSIRPFVVSAGNLHEGSSHELHLKQMNWEKKNPAKIMVLWNTYILIGKADPERETIRLGNELYMRIVLDVVDTGHVSPTLTTLFQGLVPIQLLRQNLVGQATVTLQIQRWRVVLFFQFLGGRERKHVRKMSCSRETERERKKKKIRCSNLCPACRSLWSFVWTRRKGIYLTPEASFHQWWVQPWMKRLYWVDHWPSWSIGRLSHRTTSSGHLTVTCSSCC